MNINRCGSVILQELSEVNWNIYSPFRSYNSDATYNSSIEPQAISHYFEEIHLHIKSCDYFNGLIIASSPDKKMSFRVIEPFIIRCSCGVEWYLPEASWSSQFMGLTMEEIIGSVNKEFCDSTRGLIEDKVLRKQQEIKNINKMESHDKIIAAKKNVKNALSEIEVETEI